MTQSVQSTPYQALTPIGSWRNLAPRAHLVHVYETSTELIDTLRGYVGEAVRSGGISMVLATESHRTDLEHALRSDGFDIAALVAGGQYVQLDAQEMLELFLTDSSPGHERFSNLLSGKLAQCAQGRRPVHVYGELVALLWDDGACNTALRLEAVWNDLQRRHDFALLCGYPRTTFAGELKSATLTDVCGTHSHIVYG